MKKQKTHLRGYILRPLSMPGVYERIAAKAVSKINPMFRTWFLQTK